MKKAFKRSANPLAEALLNAETLDEMKKVCDDFFVKEREKIEERLRQEKIRQTVKIERAAQKLRAIGCLK